MAKQMLIDGLHEEETRVIITAKNGQIDSYDFTSTGKNELKGNIYLAKVTRVEPSLQAAFVEYGGGKQGFLPFSEIHPDYYQIPVEDRKKLLEEEAELAAKEEEEDEVEAKNEAREQKTTRSRSHRRRRRTPRNKQNNKDNVDSQDDDSASDIVGSSPPVDDKNLSEDGESKDAKKQSLEKDDGNKDVAVDAKDKPKESSDSGKNMAAKTEEEIIETSSEIIEEKTNNSDLVDDKEKNDKEDASNSKDDDSSKGTKNNPKSSDNSKKLKEDLKDADSEDDYLLDEVEEIGADDDVSDEIAKPRKNITRRYKIQEVVKRSQIILVQVTKEERGNKGVSLTTYISLPGRYCVLMPNALKSGGISRKISKSDDRKRLKEIMAEMKKARGMSAIIRTAGIDRTKAEIKRDYEFLIKLWTDIRENAISAIAPTCVHAEGDIIKRTIRDSYSSDIDKIWVQGEETFTVAKEFMKMIMPSHAARVKHYKDDMPIFHAYEVESQLQEMHKPVAKMPSGGYIDINPTEALISVDVNSGRSTGERNVEETALKTNLEAAVELARQLRLRDLAGLVVVDFIDMYQSKNRRAVERAFKEALKTDRAKIQIGRISSFGLLEMSRQRLRPSIAETINNKCPKCSGTGLVRSSGALAFEIIRMLLREASSGRYNEIRVNTSSEQVIYMLNKHRQYITDVEHMGSLLVVFKADDSGLLDNDFTLEKVTHNGSVEKADRASMANSKAKKQRQRKPRKNTKNTKNTTGTKDNQNLKNKKDNSVKANDKKDKPSEKPVKDKTVDTAAAKESVQSNNKKDVVVSNSKSEVTNTVKKDVDIVVSEPVIEKASPPEDTPKKEGPPRKGWWRRVAK